MFSSFLLCLFLTYNSITAFVSYPPRQQYCIHSSKSNDNFKERVISPDDIATLFGSEFTYSDESDDAYDELDEEDETPDDSTKPTPVDLSVSKAAPVTNSISQYVKPVPRDENDLYIDENMGFINLSQALDKETRLSVLDSLTLESDDTREAVSRQVKYDPQASAKYRENPMNYGTYRRWKEAEMKIKERQANKNAKGKSKGKDSNDFFNSIKKLGSGPAPKGSTAGVGVAEPPSGMKNVVPKKAPGRKTTGNKRVITPDEIDSLFAKKQPVNTDPSEDQEDSEEDEQEYPNLSKLESALSSKKSFGFLIGPDEEFPDWIIEAEKAEKKKKAMKGKKQKKLTDDWRFWAACIAGTGFVTAFINIYQQTGGFGSANQELVI